MKCESIRADFVEALLNGPVAASPSVLQHLQTCDACAGEFASLQQTMDLLDEWQAPEPSPYFSSRLRARVREEAASPRASWLSWLRKPAVATAAAGLIALGAGLLESGHLRHDRNTYANNDGVVVSHISGQSSPVSDLQFLDKNADLFDEFDALDSQSQTE
jgi:anti-sigma factor RsiW